MAKAKPVEPAETQQPALFGPDQLPDMPVLVEAAKRYMHTGKITCKDEERAEALVTAYLASGSLLAVARKFKVSPNTIKAVLVVAEANGKLDGLKQRLSHKLGILAELATDAQVEALINGKVPANSLPIMGAVAIDKKALLDGDATVRVEQQINVTVAAQDVLSYLTAKGLAAPAIDVQSTVVIHNPLTDKASL